MSGTPVLGVVDPGLLTTVQDSGRPNAVYLGVPIGGACDAWSLALANALAGNEQGAAALEMTLAGPAFHVLADCVVGLAGADFGAQADRRPLDPRRSHRLRAGEELAFDTAREGTGVRGYLAVAGGVDVPAVLGSRSTCLAGGFGGLDGRPLRATDVIRVGEKGPSAAVGPPLDVPSPMDLPTPRHPTLRVVAGPHVEQLGPGALGALLGGRYSVSARSDRQGIRLDGQPLPVAMPGHEMLSEGVVWGAIQVPPDGQPICLLADHQTIGGYPVVAVVAAVDRPALGQLGAGDEVAFEQITLDEAQRLARRQAAEWAAALGRIRGTA